MARTTTKSRQSSLASTDGLTIVELLIAIVVAMVVLGSALALTLSSKNLFDTDRSRTDVNQNLRGILDIIGNDIRTAGERLNSFGSGGTVSHPLAAVEVVNGNELILRRNMVNEILPLCENVSGSVARILVTTSDSSVYGDVPQCNPLNPAVDGDSDGVPDALQEWRDYRTANGPAVGAYIYSRVDDKSDYFLYTGDPSSDDSITIATTGLQSYAYTEKAVIVLVETRRYYLNGDVLELEINGDSANALRLVNNITDFRVSAVTPDGAGEELHDDYVASGNNWTDLQGVEISLTGETQEGRNQVERSLSSRYFPRNVLSN